MAQKIIFNAPDKMYEVLKQEANKRDMTMSAIIRTSIAEWLSFQGHNVPRTMEWGGKRNVNQQ